MTCRIALLFGALFFASPSTARNLGVKKTSTRVPPVLAPNCRNVQISLGNVSATNFDYRGIWEDHSDMDFNSWRDTMKVFYSCLDPENFVHDIPSDSYGLVVERNVTIHGIFCEPEVPVPYNERQIHLLIHDLTYDKSMWHGLGLPQYSLADALASGLKGSHTLAVDLWGHGDSHGETYPDPWQVLQPPFHVKTLHEIVKRLRRNQQGLWSAFENVTFVGHGFGAQLGALLLDEYPNDVNVFVGSGFPTGKLSRPYPTEWRLVPSISTDSKYAHQPLGYFAGELNSAADRENILYGGLYDLELAELDFVSQDTIAVGEVCWSGSFFSDMSIPEDSKFTGQVCVLAGEFDRVACGDLPWQVEGEACREKLQEVCNFTFPNSHLCNISVLEHTGKAWMLHKLGPQAISTIRSWSARGNSWGNLCTVLTPGAVRY
ncbi:hypothetical protein QBC36DRAFT_381420 [Triangularia setosa]|uniref:AB hydrolase-1 domain-containing protein n=1 Tax=Triangularia setosa TaxID=2587417 RepID=A0AAN7A4E1_9PEZI|nr:hypothetical protein QBC36DRAFT_381420 [Podospora setosa]